MHKLKSKNSKKAHKLKSKNGKKAHKLKSKMYYYKLLMNLSSLLIASFKSSNE